MQHDFSSEEPTYTAPVSAIAPRIQARIDAYIQRSCAPLFLSLTQAEALECREEMRSHLESLVAAHIELGASETEAVTQALEQFGKERHVAQAWRQECEATKIEQGRGTFWSALRPIAGASLLNGFVWPAVLTIYARMNGFSSFYKMNAGQMGNVGMGLLYIEWLFIPVCMGFLLGRRARGKVFAASLLALPILQQMGYSFTGCIYRSIGLFPAPASSNLHLSPEEYLTYFGISYGVTLVCAAVGGAVGRWRRRRKLRLASSR